MPTYKKLQQNLNLQGNALPVTADWSAAADFLSLISEYCLAEKPKIIVECSSGLSTLVLAKSCQMNRVGHVYSLENGKQYQLQTKQNLQQFQVAQYADVLHTPLKKISLNETDYDWYDAQKIASLKIDMLVIDGPPGFIQKYSRFPALPVLFDQLAENACVFLDDAAREEEKEIVDLWLNQYAELSHQYIEMERGCSVIKVNKI